MRADCADAYGMTVDTSANDATDSFGWAAYGRFWGAWPTGAPQLAQKRALGGLSR